MEKRHSNSWGRSDGAFTYGWNVAHMKRAQWGRPRGARVYTPADYDLRLAIGDTDPKSTIVTFPYTNDEKPAYSGQILLRALDPVIRTFVLRR